MSQIEAVFVKGVIGSDPILEDGKPQIAFFGRSNVGKSSVINSLVQRRDLVKTSSTPGRTQQLNFFLINRSLYFVDVPGYGYAKLPKEVREKIRGHILWYITGAPRPRCSVLIVDAKVGPTAYDIETIELFRQHGHVVIVVANKADKVSSTAREAQGEKIRSALGISDFVWYSTRTKEGRDSLLRTLLELARH
ncbi:ribosome biogenesis GTP-binding protein YsxC [Candidatus Uhrbacteria bacterium]|nr:ribosome biogenesis GTP-binding protein YsxC [Candidatus Uhrbacteria bacterium]